jgi:excisionase family DNA binding protein
MRSHPPIRTSQGCAERMEGIAVTALRHRIAPRRRFDELPTSVSLFEQLLDALADRVADRLEARMPSASPKRLLTLKQAGEMIGRSAGAVNQLVKRGELRSVKCGRRVHIEISEIEAWIDRCGGH